MIVSALLAAALSVSCQLAKRHEKIEQNEPGTMIGYDGTKYVWIGSIRARDLGRVADELEKCFREKGIQGTAWGSVIYSIMVKSDQVEKARKAIREWPGLMESGVELNNL